MFHDLLSILEHTKHFPTSEHLPVPFRLLGISLAFHVGELSHLSFQLRGPLFAEAFPVLQSILPSPHRRSHPPCMLLSQHLSQVVILF